MPNANYAVIMTITGGDDHVMQVTSKSTGGFNWACHDPGLDNNDNADQQGFDFIVVG